MFDSAGGKDGMVGFPDFIYKNIVPACFMAPLKPTFDLSDAQTVLVRLDMFPPSRSLTCSLLLIPPYVPSL